MQVTSAIEALIRDVEVSLGRVPVSLHFGAHIQEGSGINNHMLTRGSIKWGFHVGDLFETR